MSVTVNGCQRWRFFIYYRLLAVFHEHCSCYWRSSSAGDDRSARLFRIQRIISARTQTNFSATSHPISTPTIVSPLLPRRTRSLFVHLSDSVFVRNRHGAHLLHPTIS